MKNAVASRKTQRNSRDRHFDRCSKFQLYILSLKNPRFIVNYLYRFCIFVCINNALFISVQRFESQYEQEQSEYHESQEWKMGNDM